MPLGLRRQREGRHLQQPLRFRLVREERVVDQLQRRFPVRGFGKKKKHENVNRSRKLHRIKASFFNVDIP